MNTQTLGTLSSDQKIDKVFHAFGYGPGPPTFPSSYWPQGQYSYRVKRGYPKGWQTRLQKRERSPRGLRLAGFVFGGSIASSSA